MTAEVAVPDAVVVDVVEVGSWGSGFMSVSPTKDVMGKMKYLSSHRSKRHTFSAKVRQVDVTRVVLLVLGPYDHSAA